MLQIGGHQLEQATKHTPSCRGHCVLLMVTELLFVFNSVVANQPPRSPHQISSPVSLSLQFPSSQSFPLISFSITFTKRNKHVAVYMELSYAMQVDIDKLTVKLKQCLGYYQTKSQLSLSVTLLDL